MNDIQLAKMLGFMSLGLGALELATGGRLARKLGVGDAHLVQAFGAREIGAGLLVLTYPDNPLPVWGRVAGDAMDLAVLASGLGSHNRRRHNTAWATLFALGTTVLDVTCAVAMTRRAQKARTTGQRTKLNRPLGTPMPKTA